MRYTWFDDYLMKKRAVTKHLQKDWNWFLYRIGDKMFAALCLDKNNEPYYINLKLEPMDGEFLRSQYPDILPGYYSNKMHWNSVKPDGAVPDELLKDMLDKSYHLVLGSFSKKRQRELLGLSCCGTECVKCSFYQNQCQGCNETGGKVFHTPDKPCPIYHCSIQKHKYATCASCEKMPCDIWLATRDPQLSQEAFDATIRERSSNLKGEAL